MEKKRGQIVIGLVVTALIVVAGIAFAVTALSMKPEYSANDSDRIAWMRYRGWDGRATVAQDGNIYLFRGWSGTVLDPDGNEIRKLPASRSSALTPNGGMCLISGNEVQYLYPNGTIRWSTSLASVNGNLASPAIGSNGTIYVPMDSRNGVGAVNGIAAIDGEGKVKWRYVTSGQPGRDIAVAGDGTVIFGSSSYNDESPDMLTALYQNGSERWEMAIDADWLGVAITLDGRGNVYVKETERSLLALDLNGTLKWRYGMVNEWWPPVVSDDSIYVCDGRFLICLADNGSERWRYEAPSELNGKVLTNEGDIVIAGTDSLQLVSSSGVLLRTVDVIRGDIGKLEGLFDPMVGPNGTIYVSYYNEGYDGLLAIGQPSIRSDVTAKDLTLNIFFVITVGLMAAASGVLLMRFVRILRGTSPLIRERPRLIRASTLVRFLGLGMGIVALLMVWRYYPLLGGTYFVGDLYGPTPSIDQGAAMFGPTVFFLAMALSVLIWYGAFLALAGLLSYTSFLISYSQNNLLLGLGSMDYGLPYGNGFLLAWVAVALLFLSGLMRLAARRDLGQPIWDDMWGPYPGR